MEPVHIPITDTLDLHLFRPGEIPALLDNYFAECMKVEIFSVRLIHGKGKGILKKRVQQLLKRNTAVRAFQDAPPEAGGWGATIVELKRE